MPTHSFNLNLGSVFSTTDNILPSTLINMFVSADNQIASFPDFRLLVDTVGTIYGITKMKNIIGSSDQITSLVTYTSHIALFAEKGVFWFQFDEAKQDIQRDNDDNPIVTKMLGNLDPDYSIKMNPPKIPIVVNSNVEALTVDFSKKVWVVSQEVDSDTYNIEEFRWENSRSRTGNNDVLQDNPAGANAVEEQYRDLLIGCDLVADIDGIGVIYNRRRNMLFFTRQKNYQEILWSITPRYSANTNIDATTPLADLGVPKVIDMASEVFSLAVLTKNLFVFTDRSVLRYTLEVNLDGSIALNQEMHFNYAFTTRFGDSAYIYQDIIFFNTEENKTYSLNSKGVVQEVTNKRIPDVIARAGGLDYYMDGVRNKYAIYRSESIYPIKFLGTNFLTFDHKLLNLDNGTFSYLYPVNSNVSTTEKGGSGFYYDVARKITAAAPSGKIFALEDKLLLATDMYNTQEITENDFFTPHYYVSEQVIFEQVTTLSGLEVLFSDSMHKVEELSENYDKMVLGVKILVDSTESGHLNALSIVNDQPVQNLLVSDEDVKNGISGYRAYTFTRKYNTNTFQVRLNIPCKSFIIVIRISAQDLLLNDNGKQSVKTVQHKLLINGIKYNTIEPLSRPVGVQK